jgi:hypothetical protein
MNGTQFVLAAYAAGLGLILAYALSLWAQFRSLRRAAVRARPPHERPARRSV